MSQGGSWSDLTWIGGVARVKGSHLLRFNGWFLLVAGTGGAIADLISYYAGSGPFGTQFLGKPEVVAPLEAHLLAALIGMALLRFATEANARFWHGFAAAVHAMLMTANLLFFAVFQQVDLVGLGVVATMIHLILALSQGAFALRPRN
jgi:hypothetical protein